MNLTIIGATGMVGTRLTTEARHRGHHVTAASRTAQQPGRGGVSTVAVDVGTGRNLGTAVAGADAVVLAVRAEAGHEDRFAAATTRVLEPGERTGRYRRGTTTLLTGSDGTSRISVEDLAVAALDELENPGIDRHVTVAAP